MDFLNKTAGRNLPQHQLGVARMNRPSARDIQKLTRSFLVQGAQHLFIKIPPLQNGKNRFRTKPSSRELPENARRLLLVLWFLQSLAAQIFPRLLFLIY